MLTTTEAGRTWDYSHNIGGQHFVYPAAAGYSNGMLFVLSRAIESVPPNINRFTKSQVVSVVRVEDHEHVGDFGAFDFTWPVDLVLDSHDNVYVSDEYQNKIAIYTGHQRVSEWGEAGDAPGGLNGPAGISFDDEDNLYVVNSLSDTVQKFTADGHFLLGWGETGTDQGQFQRAWGITVDNVGDVYVADWGNNRVQKFTSDGNYLLSFGGAKTYQYRAPTFAEVNLTDEFPGSLNHPTDVAVDADGDVYVADWGNGRVQIYAPDGEFIATLWGDATDFSPWAQAVIEANPDVQKAWRRADPGQLASQSRFNRPIDVLVVDGLRLMVTETNRFRIQVYDKLRDYVDAQINL
ncbi:MAG: NHL repeat-containing protein [SAR202 cluster bacterium]|nr:NHL repeat-containing protein [SAR202 cluster bacterium]